MQILFKYLNMLLFLGKMWYDTYGIISLLIYAYTFGMTTKALKSTPKEWNEIGMSDVCVTNLHG